MGEFLQILKDAFGLRPLVPVAIIVLAGFLFKSIRDYPLRELLYDRWFLAVVLVVASVSVGLWIFQSGLAERTPEGRYGVYVARFKGDPDRSLHTRLAEAMVANLSAKAGNLPIRINVHDFRREIDDGEDESIGEIARKLNAWALVWGTALDKQTVYLRLWSRRGGLSRSTEPVNTTDISRLAGFTSEVWTGIEEELRHKATPDGRSTRDLSQDMAALRREIAELRQVVNGLLVSGPAPPRGGAASLPAQSTALLIGVGDYRAPASPLQGPPNDVADVANVLRERSSEWRIVTLLNADATRSKILEEASRYAHDLPAEALLLVFMSGHGALTQDNSHFFLPYDYEIQGSSFKGIELRKFTTETLIHHPRTLFIIDAPFDPGSVPADTVREGAILTAGIEPSRVFESPSGGKIRGAFTAALLEALSSAPRGLSVSVTNLYASAALMLRKHFANADPRLSAGPNPPVL